MPSQAAHRQACFSRYARPFCHCRAGGNPSAFQRRLDSCFRRNDMPRCRQATPPDDSCGSEPKSVLGGGAEGWFRHPHVFNWARTYTDHRQSPPPEHRPIGQSNICSGGVRTVAIGSADRGRCDRPVNVEKSIHLSGNCLTPAARVGIFPMEDGCLKLCLCLHYRREEIVRISIAGSTEVAVVSYFRPVGMGGCAPFPPSKPFGHCMAW